MPDTHKKHMDLSTTSTCLYIHPHKHNPYTQASTRTCTPAPQTSARAWPAATASGSSASCAARVWRVVCAVWDGEKSIGVRRSLWEWDRRWQQSINVSIYPLLQHRRYLPANGGDGSGPSPPLCGPRPVYVEYGEGVIDKNREAPQQVPGSQPVDPSIHPFIRPIEPTSDTRRHAPSSCCF